ncbi:uncharacterized protein BDR25DRAFT_356605 [Lindgomyces ingoldianus]|uniref:Uncharacterized protein n=1 Tax=Lindgomyces ingoldianus TaxID=673940 RepID=A0ACB6QS78_9PLEO|nr:uncharacterized protein BDR25DRAFT_356605 [Lindgomyces ingoldianus]KAF2469375.1 hypothetical protein BDR25DRAFT_356605 [Lindgomyces ingoldianus]
MPGIVILAASGASGDCWNDYGQKHMRYIHLLKGCGYGELLLAGSKLNFGRKGSHKDSLFYGTHYVHLFPSTNPSRLTVEGRVIHVLVCLRSFTMHSVEAYLLLGRSRVVHIEQYAAKATISRDFNMAWKWYLALSRFIFRVIETTVNVAIQHHY